MLLEIKVTEDLIAASQGVSLASCLCEFLLLYLSKIFIYTESFTSYPTLCWPLPDLGHPFCCVVDADAAIKQKIYVGRKERKGKKERETSAGFTLWAVANEPSA